MKEKQLKIKQKLTAFIFLAILSAVARTKAEIPQMPADHIMVMPGDIKWGESPPGLPPGSQSAVLEGDPRAAGLFTLRVKIPANWKVMPHTHPADEHITVIEGTCNMGVGNKFDEKASMKMPIGAFAVMKMGTAHYFFTKKPCIIQIHGMGPWGISYVNAADDPRKK